MARGFRAFRREPSNMTCLVTYWVDVGVSHTEKVALKKSVLSPQSFTPTKTGYTFLGWKESGIASADVLVNKIAEGKTMTLYAVFTKTITLSYNGNGATSGSTASQTGTQYYNNGDILNPTFTLSANGYARTNYTFYRWRLNSTSGTIYTAGSSITLSANATMYAYWIATSATYNYTGGMQSFTAIAGVTYKIQCYGAQGENISASGLDPAYGGYGGYSLGYRKPTNNETWYIGVGGQGKTFNGGGSPSYRDDRRLAGYGGGASHVGLSNALLRNTAVANLIICAGGGGGATSYAGSGGTGGGTNGGKGAWSSGSGVTSYTEGTGGTQSAGGYAQYLYDSRPTCRGGYGYGGNGDATSADWDAHCAGGGGGYYGGGGAGTVNDANRAYGSGGGGSGNCRGCTSTSMSNGQKTGNGQVIISVYSVA